MIEILSINFSILPIYYQSYCYVIARGLIKSIQFNSIKPKYYNTKREYLFLTLKAPLPKITENKLIFKN